MTNTRTIKNLLIIAAILIPYNCFALNVGVISDIHAGSKKKRTAGSSVIYPKLADRYFRNALIEMQGKVDLIIVLGDNTNSGEKKYYKKLVKWQKKYAEVKVLWVIGNHDNRKKFKKYFGPTEYTYEQGGIKFAVVDNSFFHKNRQFTITPPKADIILQHIPPFYPDTCDYLPNFESEKGSTVWSGHWHEDTTCGKNKIFPSLTERKKLNYSIIKLDK